MKKSVVPLVALILAWFGIVNAQTTKSSFMLGGSFAFHNESVTHSNPIASNDTKRNTNSISFYPQLGYFIVDNFAFGLKPKVGYTKSEYDNTLEDYPIIEQVEKAFEIGPFLRYYYGFKKYAAFIELHYRTGKIKTEFQNFDHSEPDVIGTVDREQTFKSSCFSPALGFSFFANNSIGIEGTFRYENEKTERDVEDSGGNISYEEDDDFKRFLFTIGFQLYL